MTPQKKKSKEKRKKDTVGVKILTFGENENCKLTENEKQKLLSKMSAQELQYWIDEIDIAVGKVGGEKEFKKLYKSKTDTHFFTIISWKRKRESEGKPSGKATGGLEANKEYAEYVVENFDAMCQQRNCKIHVGPKYVECVQVGAQIPSTCINYTENGFKEQVDNMLRKRGII